MYLVFPRIFVDKLFVVIVVVIVVIDDIGVVADFTVEILNSLIDVGSNPTL